jgi:hypothetical protein
MIGQKKKKGKVIKEKNYKFYLPSASKQVLEKSFEFGALDGGEINIFEEPIDFLKLNLTFKLN